MKGIELAKLIGVMFVSLALGDLTHAPWVCGWAGATIACHWVGLIKVDND